MSVTHRTPGSFFPEVPQQPAGPRGGGLRNEVNREGSGPAPKETFSPTYILKRKKNHTSYIQQMIAKISVSPSRSPLTWGFLYVPS